MKKKIISFLMACLMIQQVYGQWVVSDPMHTGITSLIKLIQSPSFKSIVQNIEMLQKVVGAVQQFHRGTEIVQTITKCTSKLNSMATAVSKDGHIYPAELTAMSDDIGRMAEQGTEILKDMRTATTQSGSVLKMTDADRIKWLDETYKRVRKFEQMIDSYFNKVKAMSLKRSGNKYDLGSTASLYASADRSVPRYGTGSVGAKINGTGYDNGYDNDTNSVLNNIEESEKAKLAQKRMLQCQENQQNYYDEKSILEIKMEDVGWAALLNEGWVLKMGNGITFSTNFETQTIVSAIVRDSTGSALNSVTGGFASAILNDDSIDKIISPSGNRVTKEEFQIRLRMKVRELMPFQDAILRKKWRLEDCLTVGKNGG
jgi:hypothetical protein